MSIFFWKKNKTETEPAAPEPAVTAEAGPEVTEQITEEQVEVAAETEVFAPAEEPAEAAAEPEAPAPAEEPAEAAAEPEAPAPAKEPAAEAAAEPEAPAPATSEEIREYEQEPHGSAPEEYDYEAAGLSANPIPVEVSAERPYDPGERGLTSDAAYEIAAAESL